MKLNIKQFGLTLLCLQAFYFAYAQQVTEVNTPNTSIGYHLITGEHIIAPGSQTSTVNITQSAQVDYKAGEVIELKNGFGASGFNGNGFFHAFIDPHVSMPIDYDDNLFSQQDFDNHEIDVSKEVGYIPGSHSVTPTGAAAYTIPIPLPPGTNMVPSLAISYNSQSGNGILGMGWNISGLSAISRVPKTIYHNEKVEAIQLDATDNFALDGNRLIKIGNYYYTEAETFSRIRGEGVSGSTPQGFEVETKNGQRIYYGYTSDSRFYKENTNEILFWLISKIKDNYGNYVEFTYRQENREVVIDKISYTGNENTGLTPYNHIQFYYDYRDDKNTVYLAGASINSNLLLKKIKITADGQDFKTYKFTYGFNLYSFLKEVQEFGSDGTEKNPTIFKYADEQLACQTSQSTVLEGQTIDVYTADFNADGYSDILTASKNYTDEGIKYHTNPNIYLNNSGNFDSNNPGFLIDPSLTAILNNGHYEIPGWVPDPNNAHFADYNGDGKADMLVANKHNACGLYYLNNVKIFYSTGESFSSPVEYDPGGNDDIINLSQKCIFSGDFDGDGATDFLNLLANVVIGVDVWYCMGANLNSENYNDYREYTGYITFPRTGTTAYSIPASDFNAIQAAEADYTMTIDLDGDGKSELMVVDGENTRIYSFESDGSNVSATIIYSGGFPTKWHKIHLGDFNGDGKTDLLTTVNEEDWFISYSTGTGFTEQPFSFDYYNSTFSENIKISDYNGDGKSDILFHYHNGNLNQDIADVYYSTGTSFISENSVYQGVLSELTTGDFNGDGKSDEMNRVYYEDPVNILYFHKNEKSLLLHKVKDGFNRSLHFNFSPLTQYNQYWLGEPETYPLNKFKQALPVVTSIVFPNGSDDENDPNSSISYLYHGATVHRQGKGFLGFNKVEALDYQFNQKASSEYEIIGPHFFSTLKKKSVKLFDNTTISETVNYNILDDLDNLRFYPKCTLTTSVDYLNSFSTNISYEYYPDNNGNIKKVTTELIGAETSMIEYGAYESHGSIFPAFPSTITKSNTRGASTFTATTKFAYNDNGKPTQEITFFGLPKSVTTDFEEYDDFGNLKRMKVSSAGLTQKISKLDYDNKGRFAIKKYNPLNQNEDYTYDVKWGKPLSSKGIDGLITNFEYDGFGKLKQTTDPHGNITTVSHNWDIMNGYGSGSPTEVNNAIYFIQTNSPGKPELKVWYDRYERERKTQTEGFSGQNMLMVKSYDSRGNVFTSTNSFFQVGSVQPIVTTNTYDEYNRIITSENSTGITTFEYSSGNGLSTTTITNPAMHQSAKTKDASGKIVSATDNGGILTYEYYGSGNIKSTKLNYSEITNMTYDDYGRQLSLWDINSGTTNYIYNAYGELESQTDELGNNYTMTYDVLGRVSSKTKSGESPTIYSYVGNGNGINQVESITSPSNSPSQLGSYQHYLYDNFGRLITFDEGISGEHFITRYTYNNQDKVTTVAYPSGLKIQKNYDLNGYLASVKNETGTVTIFETNEINASGQLTEYTLGNGVTTEKSYNHLGLPENIFAPGIQDLTFTFDFQTSNLLTRHDEIKNKTEYFMYDNLNRLKSTQINNNTPFIVNYTANGNIIYKSEPGEYIYSGNKNAVEAVTNPDYNVSLTPQDISYTPYKRPFSLTEGDNQAGIFYSPGYNRIKMSFSEAGIPIKTKYYSSNYEKEVFESGQTREMNYISCGDGLNAIVVTENGENKYYYIYKDYLGSILTVTDDNGSVIAEQNFDAWGNYRDPETWLAISPEQGCGGGLAWLNRGYTGHEHLPQFGLINMNARLYDPLLGRMLGIDNYVQNAYSTQSYNRYSYVFNNPLKYIDPTGNYGEYPGGGYSVDGGGQTWSYNTSSNYWSNGSAFYGNSSMGFNSSGVYNGVNFNFNAGCSFSMWQNTEINTYNEGGMWDVTETKTVSGVSMEAHANGTVGNNYFDIQNNLTSEYSVTTRSYELNQAWYNEQVNNLRDGFQVAFKQGSIFFDRYTNFNSDWWRNAVPDVVNINFNGAAVPIYGGGVNIAFNLITRGNDAGIHITQTPTQRLGFHGSYEIGAGFGWFDGNPNDATLNSFLGKSRDQGGDLIFGLTYWEALNNNNRPMWHGWGVSGGMTVGYSGGIGNTESLWSWYWLHD